MMKWIQRLVVSVCYFVIALGLGGVVVTAYSLDTTWTMEVGVVIGIIWVAIDDAVFESDS